jgi:hypothetical protein
MNTKSRLGKKDSIFSKTTGKDPTSLAVTVAPTTSSIENKLTVILPPDQVAFLDRLCLDIRGKTKAKIRRSEVIRAFVAGIRASGMDLTSFGTEADIAAAIQKGLSK